MAALHRAVALAQRDRVAVGVGKHLHLDVAGVLHEALHVDGVVPEGRARLGARRGVGALELLVAPGLAHALAAAARGCLDEQRVADRGGDRARLVERLHLAGAAGDAGDPGRPHGLLRVRLLSHAVDDVGGRADEHEAVVRARAGEVRVFGQEAVARVDRLAALAGRRTDQGREAEVALRARGGPDAHRDVGLLHRTGVAVRLGVGDDRLDAELVQGAHDAQGYLAAVGDQDA